MSKGKRPQSISDYGFTGMFIPANICLTNKLKWNEVQLLVLISALDKGEGCEASNGWLGERLDVDPRRIQQMLSKLIRLELVVRVVSGPFRHLYVDQAKMAEFDSESCKERVAKKRNSRVKKISPLPRKKFHPDHEKNFTQVEDGRKTLESSTTVERREGGREPAGSASSIGSGQEAVKNEVAGCPCPAPGATEKAFDGGKKNRKAKNSQNATKTPKNAPWNGIPYNGIKLDQLERIESYDDIWALQGDPIWAAMCATGEIFRGGYGFWIKWLNQFSAQSSVESATDLFMQLLVETWGESRVDSIRNPASIFNNKLKSFMEVAA